MNKVETILEKQKELKEFVKKEGQAAVKEMLESFFTENPEITAVRWRGYTPGFNDGEPCTFSVYFDGVSFDENVLDKLDDVGDREELFHGDYSSIVEEKRKKT